MVCWIASLWNPRPEVVSSHCMFLQGHCCVTCECCSDSPRLTLSSTVRFWGHAHRRGYAPAWACLWFHTHLSKFIFTVARICSACFISNSSPIQLIQKVFLWTWDVSKGGHCQNITEVSDRGRSIYNMRKHTRGTGDKMKLRLETGLWGSGRDFHVTQNPTNLSAITLYSLNIPEVSLVSLLPPSTHM